MMRDLGRPLSLVADPYPPYQYLADGAVTGVDHDLVTAAFKAVGMRASTRLLAWPLCLQAMQDGTADAIFQITPTPERTEWLRFSRPFRRARTVFYQRADNIIEGFTDVRLGAAPGGYRIGVLEGYNCGEKAIDDRSDKVEAPSAAALLAALRGRDIDFAAIDEGVAQYLLGDERDISPVAGSCVTRPLHLACRRDDPEIVLAFEAGLDAITQSSSPAWTVP
jgi:polar amino acid transport system substrate-binding protein